MRIPTYASTPGLEHFPAGERFSIYRKAHHRLMTSNMDYRKRCNRFFVTVAVLCIGPFFMVDLLVAAACRHFGVAVPVIAGVVTLLEAVLVTAGILFISFRHQEFRNQHIATFLAAEKL